MTSSQKLLLDSVGFLVLPDFMDAPLLERVRRRAEELFELEGERAGSEFRQEEQTRRLANLVAKGPVFEDVIAMPPILECVEFVLGTEFKLSSLNIRSADPHSTNVQPLHADMGAVADERGYWVCNTVWMLDDFTTENGAVRAVPGSHRWGKLPQTVVSNPKAVHPEEVLVTGQAGTVVVMNAHLWHGGTANRTGAHRRAMHGFYCRSDKPQQQYQKRLVPPEVQDRLSPMQRKLLALDDPLNDELSSAGSNQSGFLK